MRPKPAFDGLHSGADRVKNTLLTCLFLAVPTLATAQEQQHSVYLEGAPGAAFTQTIRTKPFSFTDPMNSFSGTAALHYGTQFTVGGEIGLTFFSGRVRTGISYDYANATVRSATLVGTLNGVPVNGPFSRAALGTVAADFDNTVQIVALNLYYTLLPDDAQIQPYIGAGFGSGKIQTAASNEFVVTGTLGARWRVSDQIYVGARYRFSHIEGITDVIGIKYDPIEFHTVSAIVGFYLF
jgi:opacity protein-like surface antigen